MKILYLILNITLNPFVFLFYLFFIAYRLEKSKSLTYVSTNTQRLNPTRYLLICSSTFLAILVIHWGLGNFTSLEVNVLDWFQPNFVIVNIGVWLMVYWTLHTYCTTGIEGNIMGFIFAPILFFCCFVYMGLFAYFAYTTLTVNDAQQTVTSILNTTSDPVNGARFSLTHSALLHAFSPWWVFVGIDYAGRGKDRSLYKYMFLPISIFIINIGVFSIHWIVFTIFGCDNSFRYYFAGDQRLIYFLPFIAGAIIYLLPYALAIVPYGQIIERSLKTIALAVLAPAILLQGINYFDFIKRTLFS